MNADEEALVRALQPAMRELMRRWDADLVTDQSLSITEYSVLMFLSEAPSRRLGMSELARQCHQSVSAVSRTVGRLERDDLVRREQCSTDARSAEAVLTDAGLRRLKKAWPVHLRSMRRSFLDHLGEVDLPTLTAALRRMADGGDHPPAG